MRIAALIHHSCTFLFDPEMVVIACVYARMQKRDGVVLLEGEVSKPGWVHRVDDFCVMFQSKNAHPLNIFPPVSQATAKEGQYLFVSEESSRVLRLQLKLQAASKP